MIYAVSSESNSDEDILGSLSGSYSSTSDSDFDLDDLDMDDAVPLRGMNSYIL